MNQSVMDRLIEGNRRYLDAERPIGDVSPALSATSAIPTAPAG